MSEAGLLSKVLVLNVNLIQRFDVIRSKRNGNDKCMLAACCAESYNARY